jgi:hypothetical protein
MKASTERGHRSARVHHEKDLIRGSHQVSSEYEILTRAKRFKLATMYNNESVRFSTTET